MSLSSLEVQDDSVTLYKVLDENTGNLHLPTPFFSPIIKKKSDSVYFFYFHNRDNITGKSFLFLTKNN